MNYIPCTSNSRVGFYPVDRYFYPTMGRNMGKNGRNTFLPGRNGRNRVEMVETVVDKKHDGDISLLYPNHE